MTHVLERLTAALADRYRIERELGQGGMATVYLAQDLRHDRKVAIKVLRPELAAVIGAERFVVEIKTTAALQHPHILPLFDSGRTGGQADGRSDDFLYYVMPYIEGETLRSKLDRETQLGIDEAVRITVAVADALDYAHRHGVIHRDIKPENILLHDGRPMVADFGIALALSAAAGGRMTETGMSLGTPHYMSPEQATAEKEISGKSDVYSLGSVLYEMLTGSPPHVGSSAQQIIMKIVTEEAAPVTSVRKAVPPNVAAAVATALQKLPADRFASARAFAEALANPGYSMETGMPHTGGRTGIARRTAIARWAWLGWAVGGIGLALSAWVLGRARGKPDHGSTASYLNIVLPDSASLAFVGTSTLGLGRRALVLSPDGRTLVYTGRSGGIERLYRRDLGGYDATPISGTEGAFYPFVSPDAGWVGFFVGAELRKAPIGGGAAIRLAAVAEATGAEWSPDGRILVSGREGWLLGWVPASGGPIQEILNPQAVARSQPSLLPDGRHALVKIRNATIAGIGVVDLESGRTVMLSAAGPGVADSMEPSVAIRGTQPLYLPSGHLIYATPAGLVGVAFDPVTHRVGDRVAEVLGGVWRGSYGVQYAVAKDGTMVYAPGPDADRGALVWVTRDGAVDSLGFATQRYGTFALTRDGRRLAALVGGSGGEDELWVYDLDRRTESKVLTRGTPSMPRWWPDGRRILFTETSSRAPFTRVAVRQLVESAGDRDTLGIGWVVDDIAPDSSRVAGTRGAGTGAWIFPLAKGEPAIVLDSFSTAWGPTFSTDGRWIAYTSNESGQYEIYVSEAERQGARQKVSLDGGEEPLWSPRGDELIYRWGQDWFAIPVPASGASAFGRPRKIFHGQYVNVPSRSHDISPDGRRHLVVLGFPEETTTRLNVITDWAENVTRRVEP